MIKQMLVHDYLKKYVHFSLWIRFMQALYKYDDIASVDVYYDIDILDNIKKDIGE